MKYTPAPWNADEENCADGLNIKDAQDRRIAHTATIRHPDYTPLITEEARANARLIAAAPELLEALEGIMREFVGDRNSENCYGPGGIAADLARAAIAKATA